MKISDMIAQLEEYKKEMGDAEIYEWGGFDIQPVRKITSIFGIRKFDIPKDGSSCKKFLLKY